MTQTRTVEGLHSYVSEGLGLVRSALDGHVAAAMAALPQAGADYRDLWRSVGGQLPGGKGMRPAFVLAAYAGLGGEGLDGIVPVAAAMEMLHLGMLVHDDILDHDEVRRGRPNVAGTRRAELAHLDLPQAQEDDHVMAAALLGGDLALSAAYDLVVKAALPAHHRIACLELVTRAVRTTIAGELLDIYADITPPSQANPLGVAELKTSVYSCVVPLLAGARLAGADPTMETHLERIGVAIGLCFQLVDDDLGVFGDSAVTGKSVLSDLRAGKRTELLRLTYAMGTSDERLELSSLVGSKDLDDEGAERIREIMVTTGARGAAAAAASQFAAQARSVASDRVPAPLSSYLVEIIDGLVARSS